MLVKLYTAAVQGIDATLITIEVNSSHGIKFFWWASRIQPSKKVTNASSLPSA